MTDNVETPKAGQEKPETLQEQLQDIESSMLDLGDCLKSLNLIAYNVLDYSNDFPENDQTRYLVKTAQKELEVVYEKLYAVDWSQ